MATRSRKSGFLDSFADVHSPDAVRREFIEAPMDAARVAALGSLMEVGGLMTALPQAFVGSQRRELERLRAKRGADDSRVEALQASIDRAGAFRAMAERGEARLQRALVALGDPEHAFHGFVSDSDFVPLEGVTVRLDRKDTSGTTLSATTDADGYFRIPLGTSRDAQEKGAGGKSADNMADRIAEMLGRMGRADRTAPAATEKDKGPTEQASVEIVSKGKLLYRDPAPIPVGGGRVYREYLIPPGGSPTQRDVDEFVSKKARTARASAGPARRRKERHGPRDATKR